MSLKKRSMPGDVPAVLVQDSICGACLSLQVLNVFCDFLEILFGAHSSAVLSAACFSLFPEQVKKTHFSMDIGMIDGGLSD
jgi:hypothetical protein